MIIKKWISLLLFWNIIFTVLFFLHWITSCIGSNLFAYRKCVQKSGFWTKMLFLFTIISFISIARSIWRAKYVVRLQTGYYSTFCNKEKTVFLNVAYYLKVYPVLLSSMEGYGLSIQSTNCETKNSHVVGWPAVQFKALQELFVAAQRAQYRDACVR